MADAASAARDRLPKPLRIAFVGCGNIAKYHLEALHKCCSRRRAIVSVVVDLNQARARPAPPPARDARGLPVCRPPRARWQEARRARACGAAALQGHWSAVFSA